MIGAILAAARSIRVVENRLELVMPPGQTALRTQLERSDTLRALTEQASELAGRPLRLRITAVDAAAQGESPVAQDRAIETGPRPATSVGPPDETMGSSAGAALGTEPKTGTGDSSEATATAGLLELATSEPGVRKLLREFVAQVIDIQPFEPKERPRPSRRRRRNVEESP